MQVMTPILGLGQVMTEQIDSLHTASSKTIIGIGPGAGHTEVV